MSMGGELSSALKKAVETWIKQDAALLPTDTGILCINILQQKVRPHKLSKYEKCHPLLIKNVSTSSLFSR